MYYNVFVLFLSGVPAWRLINVISVQHNRGFLPDIILLTQCYYHIDRGTRLNTMTRFFLYYLQPMIPPTRFDIFSPDWGMLRRSRYVHFFL